MGWWSKGMLGVMMDRYRAQGYNLPYRYTTGRRAQARAARFPDQVAA